jgi:hypothetical protein
MAMATPTQTIITMRTKRSEGKEKVKRKSKRKIHSLIKSIHKQSIMCLPAKL